MAPTSLVVTIEKNLLEINGSDSLLLPEKQKAASPKQLTWVLLLKAHRALFFFSWFAITVKTLFASVKKRIAHADVNEEGSKSRGKLYRFIKAFLAISIAGLIVELVAHFKKWNLRMIQPLELEVHGFLQWFYVSWLSFRVDYIAPLVLMLSKFCIVLFMIQSLDRLVLCVGCFWIKFKKIKPIIQDDAYDLEDASTFPMVLVQIPMCNEREVMNRKLP